MSAEILSTLSMICFIVAGVSFAAAVFFWFKFRILEAYGDLNGRTAKRSIEKLRKENERLGDRKQRTGTETGKKVGLVTGNSTTAASSSEMIRRDEQIPETEMLESNRAQVHAMASDATTAMLEEDEDATGLLEEAVMEPAPVRAGGVELILLEEVMLIHTDETID